ncbi:MAG TPA: septal ring lytic transglycosylase RlpA family protein [Capillimicrobium sp.]|nr:septal ring lytic transglycosylase RlpA family protein [Capillimicrobium sp.]
MRLQHLLRARSAAVSAWALGIVITLVAGAPAAAQTDSQGVRVAVQDRSLGFGDHVVVRGRVAGASAGIPVTLQFRPARETEWRSAKTVQTREGGRYRVGARMWRSGRVRVQAGGASSRAAAPVAPALSAARPVRVRARVATTHVRRHVTAGRRVRVAGALRPGGRGRVVALQLRRGGRWRTVDRDRTAGNGRYRLRERMTAARSLPARVRFRGDRLNAPAVRRLGRVNGYRSAHASWYGPGLYGNHVACGGRLYPGTVGVAHKWLPCGTRLTFRYHGRVVRARVIDRGPFVAGREFDLTAALKSRLGFPDVGVVQVSQ